MRLATNGVLLQCLDPLHFSILNQFRPQILNNLPMTSPRCVTHSGPSVFYSSLPAIEILCLLIIPTPQITLGSSLHLMLPSATHLTPVLHPLAVEFPEAHCRNGSIKICLQIKSFKCLHSVLFLIFTPPPPTFLFSQTLARATFPSWVLSVPRICNRLALSYFPTPSLIVPPLSFSFPFIFWLPSFLNDVIYHIASENSLLGVNPI